MITYIKDPDAVLDYLVDWSEWLADAETIDTSTILVETGITKDSDTHDTTSATVWLSGGTLGETYEITNRIVTNQGRTDDRTILIYIAAR